MARAYTERRENAIAIAAAKWKETIMRQKELRIALVCYGGVSLAVYMHGVTKELWKLARASRDYHEGTSPLGGTEAIYARLLERIERHFK